MIPSEPSVSRQSARIGILGVEVTGFSLAIAAAWLTESLDPPFSWSQVLIETVVILVAGVVTITMTQRLVHRIKTLEGFLSICASCKKVRVDGRWIPIEDVLDRGSDLRLSHGVCDDCAQRLYGEYLKDPHGHGSP